MEMLAGSCPLPALLEGGVRFQVSIADMATKHLLFLARLGKLVPLF
jgi:hypothetical protein